MKTIGFVARMLAVWVWLVVVHVLLGMLIPTSARVPENAAPWFLLSNSLIAVVLCVLASRSDWRGARLALAVSGIPVVITLTNYLEGVVFLTAVDIDWSKEVLRVCLVAVLTMPLWPLLFRKHAPVPGDSRRLTPIARENLMRFVVADLAYPLLYFAAGMLVFPFVRDFYATQTIPPMGYVLALQLLMRGPIFVGVCWLMTRMLGLPRVPGAVAVGAAFAALSGIAPLIIPSGVFPDAVRWAHFTEVTLSNFIFGALVAWLWAPPHNIRQLVRQAA
jgi:hypothetical protein